MDEIRFGRLEDKVDKVKDEVGEIKMEVHEIGTKMDLHMDKVDEHITGDRKIINQIEPLLSELPSLISIVKDYENDKIIKNAKEEERTAKVKKYKDFTIKAGAVSTVIGIIATIYKVFF